MQLGGQVKDFGSQAFYSIAYPDQFEATRTLNASVTHSCFCENMRVETSLYGRLHSDRFELFREGVVEPASWYSRLWHPCTTDFYPVTGFASVVWHTDKPLHGVRNETNCRCAVRKGHFVRMWHMSESG